MTRSYSDIAPGGRGTGCGASLLGRSALNGVFGGGRGLPPFLQLPPTRRVKRRQLRVYWLKTRGQAEVRLIWESRPNKWKIRMNAHGNVSDQQSTRLCGG